MLNICYKVRQIRDYNQIIGTFKAQNEDYIWEAKQLMRRKENQTKRF